MREALQGPLQDFLVECATDGDFDSAGEFTLDSELARRKLARYHEADPDNFLIQWIRFACLSEPTHTRIFSRGSDLILTHDGKWPSRGSIRNLYGQEKGPGRALAYCVWNALRYRYSECRLRTQEGEIHYREYSQDGARSLEETLQPLPTTKSKNEEPSCCLILIARPAAAKTYPPLGLKQCDKLRQRCAYAPIRIEFLGQSLDGPEPYTCVMHGWLTPQGNSDWAQNDPSSVAPPLRTRWPRPRTESWHKLVTREAYRAALFIGVQGAPESLHFVLDGVCHEAPLPWRLPRVLIVLSSPRLRLDLSGDRLVRNEGYRSVLGSLVVDLDRFFRHTVTQIDQAPAGLVPYLEALISVRLRSKDFKSAYEICRWVFLKGMGHRVRKDFSLWQRASFLYRFALVSKIMRDPHSAKVSAEQAEVEWSKAPLKDERWLPHSHESPAELSQAERISLCRLAVEVQTLEDGAETVRAPLLALIGKLERDKRWGAAVYCLRWLVELDAGLYPMGHRRLATDLGRLGVALVRANQSRRNPPVQRWQEARYVLASSIEGWGRLAPPQDAPPAKPQASPPPKGWLADAAMFMAAAPAITPPRRPQEADLGFLLTLLELQVVVDGHLADSASALEKMHIWLAQMEGHDPVQVRARAKRFKSELRAADVACLALLDERMLLLPAEARAGARFFSFFRSSQPADEFPEDE